jgi:hypothetical protein
VASSLSNLAELYRGQGQNAKAEPLYQRALTIFEKVLGPEYSKSGNVPGRLTNLGDNRPHFLRAPHLNVECFFDLETPQGR